jgi:Ca2+-binding RTX toxin-like protein
LPGVRHRAEGPASRNGTREKENCNMIKSAAHTEKARTTLLGAGLAVGLVLLALIVVGRASAHTQVIDFSRTCEGHRADGHQHADTIIGSRICKNTPDIFRGLYGPDRIYGYLGNDILLKGSKGDDLVSGGAGKDWIEGADGADTLSGGRGSDHIEGGADPDKFRGGRGNDQMWGQDGDDLIRGNAGNDIIDCGPGEDEAWGGPGRDTFANCEITHQ